MINDYKPNDFVAATLNSAGKLTLDDFKAYDLTPDNTGIKDENYYKNIPQIQEKFQTKDGEFDNDAYTRWYDSTLNLYNTWANDDYTDRLIQSIETSPNDIFSLGNYNIRNDEAKIVSIKDPQRHSMGLGNIYEAGNPTFDIREVAQANTVSDENGNDLGWTPNERGGLFKGIFRPTLVLATYDKDEDVIENGVLVHKRKGDIKLKNGDPYYEIPKSGNLYDKEILQYTDTLTDDDSYLNKFDFMDSDGLRKSVGGTLAKTAFMLAPYFIPGVGEILGWAGAGLALGQTLPVLGKAIDGIFTGSTNDGFGKTMSSMENYLSRFNGSTSREGMENFFNVENIGKMVYDSAGQLFQQRNIINASQKLLKMKDLKKAQKIGSAISLGYMASTSSIDAYSTFKQMGMSDRMAGLGVIGVMSGIYALMDSGYFFKDAMFKDTWLDEDQTFRNSMKALAKANEIETKRAATSAGVIAANNTGKAGLMENIKWLKKAKDATINFFTKGNKEFESKIAKEGILGAEIAEQPWWASILARGVNEGVEEIMEENVTDVMKGIALGLQSLGLDISEKEGDKVDWGETLAETMQRYATAGIGGFIGGMTFDVFNQYERIKMKKNGSYINRNAFSNMVRFMADPELKQEAYDWVKKQSKKGNLGDKNLSMDIKVIKDDEGNPKIVFKEGTSSNNQNTVATNTMMQLLKTIESSINDVSPFFNYNGIHNKIVSQFIKKAADKGMSLNEYLEENEIDMALLTAKEEGYTRFIYDNLTNKLAELVEKNLEIENRKSTIRSEGGYTDANNAKYEEALENDVNLKEKKKEFEKLKKEYQDYMDGKYNDIAVSYVNFASNPSVFSAYFNDPDFTGSNKSAIPETNIQNFVMQKTGKNYNDLSQIEKDYYDKQYNEFKSSDQYYKKLKNAFYVHYNLSDKMSKDIMNANTKLGEWRPFKDEVEYSERLYDTYISTIDRYIETLGDDDFLLKNELNSKKQVLETEKNNLKDKNYLISLKEENNEKDLPTIVNEKADEIINSITLGIDYASFKSILYEEFYKGLEKDKIFTYDRENINEVISDVLNAAKKARNWNNVQDYTGQANFWRIYNDKTGTNFIDNSIDSAISKYIHEFAPLLNPVKRALGLENNATYEDIVKKINENGYAAQVIMDLFNGYDSSVIDSITDYAVDENLNIDEQKIKYDEALKEIKNFIEKNKDVKFLFDSRENNVLKDLFDNLISALSSRDINKITDAYNKLEEKLNSYNFEGNKKDIFKTWLFTSLNENDNFKLLYNPKNLDRLVNSTFKSYNNLIPNPIIGMLKKLSSYNGNKFNQSINFLQSEIDKFKAMGDKAEDEYMMEPTIQTEVEQAGGLLNIVEALLTSATNGDNKQINAFRKLVDLSDFAEISEQARQIFANKISEYRENINKLITISNKNAGKVLMQQVNTTINCEPKVAFKVIDIIKLANVDIKDDKKIDIDGIKNRTLDSIGIAEDEITKGNYKTYKDALNKFWVELYNEINSKYKTKEELLGFYKTLIGKISELGKTKQTDFSPETSIVTDFTALQWLITNTITDPVEVDKKYDKIRKTEKFKNIIPFFTQEMILKSLYVQTKNSDFINDVLDEIYAAFKEEIKNSSADDSDKAYMEYRLPLFNYYHIDGIAGAGKTELMRMVEDMLKEDGDVKVLYTATSKEHLNKDILPRFEAKESAGMTIDEILKVIFGDDYDGDVDKYSVFENSHRTLKKEVKDKLEQKLNDGSLEDIFDKSYNGKRVLFIDEDGFLNQAQLEALTKYAKKYNINIIGSGDTTQNGAVIKGTKSGLTEDFISWSSPFLTVSMRTNNNGQKNNQEKLFEKLNNIRLKSDIISTSTDFANLAQDELNGGTKLIYNEEDGIIYGEKRIDNNDAEKERVVKELKAKVEALNNAETDPAKKNHRLVIVADATTAAKYNSFVDDNCKVASKDAIQGSQADFILVDRTDWSDDKYLLLRDFYTMMSRAKTGAVFVDGDYLSKLDITFEKTDSASVRLSDEQFLAAIENYKTWRNELPNMEPGAQSNPSQSGGNNPSGTSGTSGNGGSSSGGTSSGGNSPAATPGGEPQGGPKQSASAKTGNLTNARQLKTVQDKRNERNNILNQSGDGYIADGDAFSNSITEEFLDFNFLGNSDEDKAGFTKGVKFLAKAIMWRLSHGAKNNKNQSANVDENFVSLVGGNSALRIGDDNVRRFFNFEKAKFRIRGNFLTEIITATNDNEIEIPIAVLKDTGLAKDSGYELTIDQLNVDVIAKADKFSTNGEDRFKVSEVFDMDFVNTNGGVSVLSVVKDKVADTNKGFANANKGKAMLAIPNDPSRSLNDSLKLTIENEEVTYYGQEDAVVNIGVQNTIDFSAFVEIADAKFNLVSKDGNREEAKRTLRRYFDNENDIVEGENRVRDNSKNSLKNYSTLHWTSVSKLITALAMYMKNPGLESQKSIFAENLVKLINGANFNNGKNGFSITFTDKNNAIRTLNIFKDSEGKYSIWKADTNNNILGTRDIAIENVKFGFKENKDLLIEDVIKNILTKIKEGNNNNQFDDEWTEFLDIADKSQNDIVDMLKNGSLSFGTIRSVKKDGSTKVYSAFDSDIINLLRKNPHDKFDQNLINNISTWLKGNTIFKYALFANIIAGDYRKSAGNADYGGWKNVSVPDVGGLTVDVAEYHEPIFKITINNNSQPVEQTFKNINDVDDSNTSIDIVTKLRQLGNQFMLNNGKGVEANHAWINKYVDDPNGVLTDKKYKITSIKYDKNGNVSSIIILVNNIPTEFNIKNGVNVNNYFEEKAEIKSIKTIDGTEFTIENDIIFDKSGKKYNVVSIPNSDYSILASIDGDEDYAVIKNVEVKDLPNDGYIRLYENENGETLVFKPETNKYFVISQSGLLIPTTEPRYESGKYIVSLANENAEIVFNEDDNEQYKIGNELALLNKKQFIKYRDEKIKSVNFEIYFSLNDNWSPYLMSKSTTDFDGLTNENKLKIDGKIAYYFMEGKLKNAKSLKNYLKDQIENQNGFSKVYNLLNQAISENNSIENMINDINEKLKNDADKNFTIYYELKLNGNKFSIEAINYNYYKNRSIVYSNYKNNGIKSIEKIDNNISKFKVTFNDNSTKIIEVNSDEKTIENIAEQGLSNPEVNNNGSEVDNNSSEVDNKKLEEKTILINIDKGIEAINEDILSLDDKILLNSMVRKMFANKADAENIMDKINEIINKIAEKTDPLSIDVINEIQNQFNRILDEFSC